MKIGTESMIFREKTDERRCLELIAGAGFDCVDYSMFNLAGKKFFLHLSKFIIFFDVTL